MDDLSVILKRFLGAATGAMLRVGLVSVLSFIGLINAENLPTLVADYIVIFLTGCLGISFAYFFFLALVNSIKKEVNTNDQPASAGQDTATALEHDSQKPLQMNDQSNVNEGTRPI